MPRARAPVPPAPVSSFVQRHRLELLVCLGLALATAASYSTVLGNDFVYDDGDYVLDNSRVKGGLTLANVSWAWTTFFQSNWHPLTWMSLQLDASLLGTGPAGFHLTNVVLHLANTVLLFVVLQRMTGALGSSAFVAGVFGLHPLHVESVAWITERKDVLSTLFWLLTMLAYYHYVQRPGLLRYLLVVLPFVLGLLAKPMLVTLPCVLLLLDYWPLRRGENQPGPAASLTALWRRWWPLVWEKLPLFALSAASSVITWYAQQRGGSVARLDQVPLEARLGNAVVAYATYLRKMFWPSDLAPFYPHPGINLSIRDLALALLVLAALSWAGWRWRQTCPALLVGWLWYLGTLVPVIGLVQVGSQALADRYTYVPLMGATIALTWPSAELARRWHWQKILSAVGRIALVACALLTWNQVSYWKDDLTLWTHTLALTGSHAVVHENLGVGHAKRKQLDQAIRELQRAVNLAPLHLGAHQNLAGVLIERGRFTEAAELCRQVLQADPQNAAAHRNLGGIPGHDGQGSGARLVPPASRDRVGTGPPWFSWQPGHGVVPAPKVCGGRSTISACSGTGAGQCSGPSKPGSHLRHGEQNVSSGAAPPASGGAAGTKQSPRPLRTGRCLAGHGQPPRGLDPPGSRQAARPQFPRNCRQI